MSLELNTIVKDGITVIEFIGNLDTNTAPEAESVINIQLAEGVGKIILNLGKTNYVSSAGLRVFLATAKKMTASGGAVKLCSPNPVVREILDISGFSTILDVKETEDEALSAL